MAGSDTNGEIWEQVLLELHSHRSLLDGIGTILRKVETNLLLLRQSSEDHGKRLTMVEEACLRRARQCAELYSQLHCPPPEPVEDDSGNGSEADLFYDENPAADTDVVWKLDDDVDD